MNQRVIQQQNILAPKGNKITRRQMQIAGVILLVFRPYHHNPQQPVVVLWVGQCHSYHAFYTY